MKKEGKITMTHLLNKYRWWFLGVFYLYPFYCLLINKITGLNLGELYTFNLPLNEFITVWIALGGILGVVSNIKLTQKRITVQEQQHKAQSEQFNIQIKEQNRQLELQHKQLRHTHFSTGVELLGNRNESARIGGLFDLFFLANDYKEYVKPVCEIFCAHIRTITNSKDYQENYQIKPSNEVQTILDFLFKPNQEKAKYREPLQEEPIFSSSMKNLKGTFLNGANFYRAMVINAEFGGATINKGEFYKTKFAGVDFYEVKMRECEFKYSKLDDVSFFKAEIKDAIFVMTTLVKVHFTKALISGVQFKIGVSFDDVIFNETTFIQTNFDKSKFSKLYFKDNSFSKTYFSFNKKKEKDNFKEILSDDVIEGIVENDMHIEITTPGLK